MQAALRREKLHHHSAGHARNEVRRGDGAHVKGAELGVRSDIATEVAGLKSLSVAPVLAQSTGYLIVETSETVPSQRLIG